MAKSPTGNRPVPPIASGVGSDSDSRTSHKGDKYSGSRGTKPPTGNRPVPGVPNDAAPAPKAKNRSKPATPFTPMPKGAGGVHKTDKAHGGGGGY